MSTSQPFGLPDFDPKVILQLFLEQKYGAIADEFLRIFSYFDQQIYTKYPATLKIYIDHFLTQFFYIFTQSEFELPDHYARAFIRYNKLIANLTAISSHKTTDIYLKILLPHWEKLGQILTLYSPRNDIQLDYNKIFVSNPELACYWYSHVFSHYLSGLVNPNVAERLKSHCAYDHPNLTEFFNHADLYLGSTYIDPNLDRILKYQLNQSLQRKTKNSLSHGDLAKKSAITPAPQASHKPKRMAIVSDFWYPQHSVYRTLFNHIASLGQDYELTLIYFTQKEEKLDTTLFQKVIHLPITAEQFNFSFNLSFNDVNHPDKFNHFDDFDIVEFFREKDFCCVYFTDVGMESASIYLANLRLAPIQCSGVGAGVSSFGAKIDYFFSGKQVEQPRKAKNFYSETLVLLPGAGITHNPIDYELTEKDYTEQRCLVINCPWSAQKMNVPLLQGLKKMTEKAHQPLLFRFFCGASLRENSYLTFVEDVAQILPREYFEVVPAIAYRDYMRLMETGAIALDSFHVGGCNSVVDSLYLRKPTVVYEGDRWYNRIGAQILRQAGLVELIATTEKDYFSLALKLILDTNYRQQVGDRLQKLDFEQTLFNAADAKYFKKAMDYLLLHHDDLQQEISRQPIMIERD